MFVSNLCFSFKNEVLYDECSFQFNAFDKVGIIGVNGAGKSTLFKILLGDIKPDRGKIHLGVKHIGYLSQTIQWDDLEKTVYDYLEEGRPIKILQEKLNKAYENQDMKLAAKITEELDYYNQYCYEDELLEVLFDLKIDLRLLDKKINELSGGQKSKIAFARLFYSKAELLLLDEPTNHLDKETYTQVIHCLKKIKATILVISHDNDFLDSFVNKILFLNKVTHKMKVYIGNTKNYLFQRNQELYLQEKRIEQQEKEIKNLQNFVMKAKQATRTNHHLKAMGLSKEKLLNKKIKNKEVKEMQYHHVKMDIPIAFKSEKIPIKIENMSFSYGNKPILTNINFSIERNEKFLIVGKNGVGKSTLLKLIVGILHPSFGKIEISSHTKIGYYAQEQELLNPNKTIIEDILEKEEDETRARKLLTNFLFFKEDITKKIKVLSLGEKARLSLLKVLISKANTILLDEPTNHFDLETQKIIGENFADFKGTLLLVSHNKSFVKTMPITRILLLETNQIVDYDEHLVDQLLID